MRGVAARGAAGHVARANHLRHRLQHGITDQNAISCHGWASCKELEFNVIGLRKSREATHLFSFIIQITVAIEVNNDGLLNNDVALTSDAKLPRQYPLRELMKLIS